MASGPMCKADTGRGEGKRWILLCMVIHIREKEGLDPASPSLQAQIELDLPGWNTWVGRAAPGYWGNGGRWMAPNHIDFTATRKQSQ